MAQWQGKFAWYDLMTTDTAAAAAFYTDVIGWKARDSGLSGPSYTVLSAGEAMVGGIASMPQGDTEGKPAWLGNIGVDDLDTYVKKVVEAGGSIHREPTEIPTIGRFAVAADPHGAVFLLFEPLTPMPLPDGVPPVGHVAWHELHAGDRGSAFAFYSELFGWVKQDAIEMGPMGTYQLFGGADGVSLGGMMTKAPETPSPTWLFYIHVDGVSPAAERIQSGGGQVLTGPMQVPGGGWVAHAVDPLGARFAVTGRKE